MDNFNLFNQFNISQKPAGLVGQNQNTQNAAPLNLPQQPQMPQNPQNQLPLPMFNGSEPAVIYESANFETLLMKDDVLLKYLQNLLKLPESIDKFINELKTNPKNAQIAAKILAQNLVDVKALNQFLNTNSKEAIQKLYETISQALKSGSKDITQLKELVSVLNFIQNSTNLNPQSIKEFLLLYLPLDIKEFQNNSTGAVDDEKTLTSDKDYDIKIMVQSVNFSNIMCSIKEQDNSLFIDTYSNAEFPYEHFLKLVNYMVKELNLNVELEHHETKDDKKYDKQSFNVASKGAIPVNALILTQCIIKLIYKIDNDFT